MGKIMIQGTGIGVGKNIVTAALCRILSQDGRRVVPFKPVSVSGHSCFTADDCELDEKMNMLAASCKKTIDILMNPVFLKPAANDRHQVLVMGKVFETTSIIHHLRDGYSFMDLAKNAYNILLSQNEDIIVCGSGGCGDNYFAEKELGNMTFASENKLPVLLVADCSRGGTVASICGTLYMLGRQKRRVQGVILNKCPYDRKIIEEMQRLIPVPVLGNIPTFGIKLDLDDYHEEKIKVEIIRFPSMVGSSDFFPLENRDDTDVRYIKSYEESNSPDLLIIPDCRSFSDAKIFIREKGFDIIIRQMAAEGKLIAGIGNGYAAMGSGSDELNILDLRTCEIPERYTKSFEGVFGENPSPYFEGLTGLTVKGTEIRTVYTSVGFASRPVLGETGACSAAGNVFGTSVHGLLENEAFLSGLMTNIKSIKGMGYVDSPEKKREAAFDSLADMVRENCDMEQIYKIMGDPYESKIGNIR